MKFWAIAACSALLASAGASAQTQPPQDDSAAANTATSPDVNLTPRRVVFGPNDRGVKEITVFNRSNKEATYTIVLLDQVMTPTGALVSPDKAPEQQKARFKSATEWVRYSPRQVTLGPQSSQTVRVQARRPADAPPGEYRTHFSVTAVPPADSGVGIEAAASGVAPTGLQIRLTPVYGIMIPIIVRIGELPAQAAISDVKLLQHDGRQALQFAVNRSGDRSVYGGFDAFVLGSGQPQKIGQLKGVGVYGELDSRQVAIAMDEKAPALRSGSKVRIVYTDDELKPGTVLAETEVTLP